jgi:hypothetical protein
VIDPLVYKGKRHGMGSLPNLPGGFGDDLTLLSCILRKFAGPMKWGSGTSLLAKCAAWVKAREIRELVIFQKVEVICYC